MGFEPRIWLSIWFTGSRRFAVKFLFSTWSAEGRARDPQHSLFASLICGDLEQNRRESQHAEQNEQEGRNQKRACFLDFLFQHPLNIDPQTRQHAEHNQNPAGDASRFFASSFQHDSEIGQEEQQHAAQSDQPGYTHDYTGEPNVFVEGCIQQDLLVRRQSCMRQRPIIQDPFHEQLSAEQFLFPGTTCQPPAAEASQPEEELSLPEQNSQSDPVIKVDDIWMTSMAAAMAAASPAATAEQGAAAA